MIKTLAISLAVSSIVPVTMVAGFAALAKEHGPQAHRTLQVSGDAQIRVVPDKATFTVIVDADDADKKRAQQRVQEQTAKVIEAATKAGVSAAGLTVAHVSLSPEYALDRAGNPIYTIVKRWRATRTITVCVEDLKKMNGVFGAIIDAGGLIQGDVVFDTSRLEELRGEARRLAAEAARKKAEVLVETLGGSVGIPQSISERDPSWSGPLNYKNAVEDWRNGAFSERAFTDGAFSAGQMIVSAHVDVTFSM